MTFDFEKEIDSLVEDFEENSHSKSIYKKLLIDAYKIVKEEMIPNKSVEYNLAYLADIVGNSGITLIEDHYHDIAMFAFKDFN